MDHRYRTQEVQLDRLPPPAQISLGCEARHALNTGIVYEDIHRTEFRLYFSYDLSAGIEDGTGYGEGGDRIAGFYHAGERFQVLGGAC